MSAASSVVRMDVAVVQDNESVAVRSRVEGTRVSPESTPLLEGAKKLIRS